MVVVPPRHEREHPLRALRGFAERHERIGSGADHRLLRGVAGDPGATGPSAPGLAETGATCYTWLGPAPAGEDTGADGTRPRFERVCSALDRFWTPLMRRLLERGEPDINP